MKRLLCGIVLVVLAGLLSGCYYDPGYSYVRGNGYVGPAYYGYTYDNGYYVAPTWYDGWYGNYGYGYGGYGYYGCCYARHGWYRGGRGYRYRGGHAPRGGGHWSGHAGGGHWSGGDHGGGRRGGGGDHHHH